jgi:hypothetical protein
MLLKDEEIAKLKIKSDYDEDKEDWVIPPFMLKGKEVTLPSLKKNGYDVMDQEKENRDMVVDGGNNDDDEYDNDEDMQPQKRTGGLFANAANGSHRKAQQSEGN